MDRLEKENRLNEIRGQINRLSIEKCMLETQLIDECEDPLEKIRIWVDSDTGGHHNWIPDKDEFPIFRERIDLHDFNRNQTIDIFEDLYQLEDELHIINNPEDAMNEFGEDEYNRRVKEDVIPLFTELMEGNLKSFDLDW